jgi:hypothetical protein
MSEQLLDQIRAAKPAAPATLRERVRSLSAAEPAPEPLLARLTRGLTQSMTQRRLLVALPLTLVLGLLAAGVVTQLPRDTAGERDAVGAATVADEAKLRAQPAPGTLESSAGSDAALPSTANPGFVSPVPGQLQRFEAQLSLRVDDLEGLSDATKRAQRIAFDHGGSVAGLQYDAPGVGTGSAQITLRIPTARVSSALAQLSQLGTILGQSYGIQDLQQQADSLQTQIEQTQRRIAQILTQLESPTLSAENRAVLQSRLTASRQKLTGLREGLRSTNAEARTATIFLTLTTEELKADAGDTSPLDRLKDVLAWEGIALLYVLVIAGPFVLLGLIVWLSLRFSRRRRETRLLEQN